MHIYRNINTTEVKALPDRHDGLDDAENWEYLGEDVDVLKVPTHPDMKPGEPAGPDPTLS